MIRIERRGGPGAASGGARALGVVALGSLAGCIPSAPAKSTASSIVATHLVAPAGSPLVEACTPTGPELCFNAIDDNCNGVIDEGCGLETGILQFTIAWGASPADVNLGLSTPDGERVPGEHSNSTPSGFHLDRDCPADEACAGQNVENIYFDGVDPPRGRYAVEISLGEVHGAELPVHVRFGGRLGPQTVGFDIDLAPGESARKTFSFELP